MNPTVMDRPRPIVYAQPHEYGPEPPPKAPKPKKHCLECGQTTGNHARYCPEYAGPHKKCPECTQYPAAGHERHCSRRETKTCDCKNHKGLPKAQYPNKGAADGWSRIRWAGLAVSYKCDAGVWHLTTRGSIRR